MTQVASFSLQSMLLALVALLLFGAAHAEQSLSCSAWARLSRLLQAASGPISGAPESGAWAVGFPPYLKACLTQICERAIQPFEE